jgi:hypothetical protein
MLEARRKMCSSREESASRIDEIQEEMVIETARPVA